MKKKKILPYILALVVIAFAVLLLVVFIGKEKDSAELAATATPEVKSTEIVLGTAIPDEMAEKVDNIKKYILENGYDDKEDYLYLGCMFGENLYCSVRYYEKEDVLSLVNSYYVETEEGAFMEVLAVLNDFPHETTVRYYEDYYGVANEDGSANPIGTLKAEAIYNPAVFTADSTLEFAVTEESDYGEDDAGLETAFTTANKFSMMSFNFWDELLELQFEVNLKDFGFTEFVREDYTAESAE